MEDDYALSREEFYAKMPVHRRVDGKLLIKKLKENNELVEQAISAVVIDHFINLETQCSHGVTEESKEVKVLIRNQPELHAVFSSDGITFEGEGNVQRRWGSSDSLEFLRQLSVVLKIIERLIKGYTKEDKEIVGKVYEFAGKKHGKSELELVPLRSELGKKQAISAAELGWIKNKRSLYCSFKFNGKAYQVPLLQSSYPEITSCLKHVFLFGKTVSGKAGFSVGNIILGPVYDAMINLAKSDSENRCLNGIWVRRCPVCFKVFSNVDSEVDVRQRYCSNVCLAAGRGRTTLVAKERNKRKKHGNLASSLADLLSKGPRLLDRNLTVSNIGDRLRSNNKKKVFMDSSIKGLLRQSEFRKLFEEETDFKLERREIDKTEDFYIFSRKI